MKIGDRVTFTHRGKVTSVSGTSVQIRDDDSATWWVHQDYVTALGPETVLDGSGDRWKLLSNGKYGLSYNAEDLEAQIKRGYDRGRTLAEIHESYTAFVPYTGEDA